MQQVLNIVTRLQSEVFVGQVLIIGLMTMETMEITTGGATLDLGQLRKRLFVLHQKLHLYRFPIHR
jgi:hypothetical protein